MKTTIPVSTGLSGNALLKKNLLICGILSSLHYVAMLVFVPMGWEGYSSASQTVSELSAIDAPSRSLWVPLGLIWTLLYVAFGLGVWKSAGANRALRVVGSMIIAAGILGIFWPPMHQREVLALGGGTLTDTLHIVWTILNGILTLLAMGFGAVALGSRFRLYSIASMVILMVAGALGGMDAPKLEANLPTPWVGVWERINIGVWLLWVAVLATILLQDKKHSDSKINDGKALEAPKRPQRRWQRITLLSVLGYEASGAILGGILLIVAPDGRFMDMPVDIMHGFFHDFLIPGLILLGLGVLNVIAFVAVFFRTRNDWGLAVIALGGMFIWFVVEIIILQELHWLHLMWGLPVVVGGLVTLPLIPSRHKSVRKALLLCGVLSAMIYIGTDLLAGMLYEGYSFRDQFVSELFAIGAPTSHLVVPLFSLSSGLIAVFALGVWLSSGHKLALRFMAVMLLGNAINSLVLWNFFPMHMRGAELTFTDTMHLILSINPFVLLTIGSGVLAFRNWFRFYSLGTILILLTLAIFSYMKAPEVSINQPTPWAGLTERIAQYSHQLWQAVLAFILMGNQAKWDQHYIKGGIWIF